MRWPDFFIVGAVKSGTTSLHHYLRAHPDIFLPSRKEFRYFNHESRKRGTGGDRDDQEMTESQYKSHFLKAGTNQLIGEASPQYFASPLAACRIHEQCPNARIIIMLREPVTRAFSEYLMVSEKLGKRLPDFTNAVRNELSARSTGKQSVHQFVARGEYGRLVPEWIKTFGAEHVGIFLFEDLVNHPSALVRNILLFLNLDPGKLPSRILQTHLNPYSVPRSGPMGYAAKSRILRSLWTGIIPFQVRRTRLRSLLYKTPHKPEMDAAAAKLLAEHYRDDINLLELELERQFPQLHVGILGNQTSTAMSRK